MVRRLMWRLVNRFGGPRLRAWGQDDQHRRGALAHLADDRRPRVTELVEGLADGGRVVEHACGGGHLAALVDPERIGSWTGFDISRTAVDEARRRNPDDRFRFDVCAFADWAGDEGLALIVCEECLNYLRADELPEFLERCRSSLAADGALFATFHDPDALAPAIAACRTAFPRHEEEVDPTGALLLTLRP